MRRVAVFFYGLFMDDAVLREKGTNPVVIGPAAVQGYSLRIGARATLVPDTSESVHGILMELTHPELDRLYREESLRTYRPEAVLCQRASGSARPALCFNLEQAPASGERNETYTRQLRALAARLKLPEPYVESIGAVE